MANIEDWPSRERWLEIEDSVTNSKFREDAKGQTYASYGLKYEKQINRETEILFADCIINWLSDRIRLTKLSDDLVNAMADDTNLYCRYLEQHFTQSQKDVRKVSFFTWNGGRRLFYIILDTISPGRNTLSRAIIVKDERKKYHSEQKSIHFDASMQTIYESKPKTKMISFNPVSLFKIPSHKRHLSKWFRESKVFDIEGDDEKLTPSEYLELCYHQIFVESGKKEFSHIEMSKLKNQFTRKFRPWLVDSINAYWFDVMAVAEKKKHHKSQHVSQPLQRKQPIKFYDRYTLCLIVHAWFESESEASNLLDSSRNFILKGRFNSFFPKSESHYATASNYINKIDEIIKLEINLNQEINSEPELPEEKTMTQKEKDQAWSDRFKTLKLVDIDEEKIISGISIMKGDYCEECKEQLREYSKERYELRCPNCGSVSEEGVRGHGKVILETKRLRLNSNNIESPEGKTKMRDWEQKIWDFAEKVFLESHIPTESQKRINNVIASKIKLIKRFKNPITYE